MKSVVIVGAGGHGIVVADILLAAQDAGTALCPVAFVDDEPSLLGTAPLGVPVQGRLCDLHSIPHEAIVVAVGDNARRAQLAAEFARSGETFARAIHPTAVIAREVTIGAGAMICAGAIVNSRSAIGENVILNTGCSVDHDCEIGKCAHVAPGARLGGSVRIGDGAFVGMLAAVLPGRVAGAWSTVGAGAVVVRNVEPGRVVAGVPAAPLER